MAETMPMFGITTFGTGFVFVTGLVLELVGVLKGILVCGNLLLCCFWLEGAWDLPLRCEDFLFLPFFLFCAKLILWCPS